MMHGERPIARYHHNAVEHGFDESFTGVVARNRGPPAAVVGAHGQALAFHDAEHGRDRGGGERLRESAADVADGGGGRVPEDLEDVQFAVGRGCTGMPRHGSIPSLRDGGILILTN